MGLGKIPHLSLKVHSIFPIYGTAVVVKINFPIRGFAAHGEIYLHHSCSAIHGENIAPFVIHGEIFFPPLVASPLEGKIPVPISPH